MKRAFLELDFVFASFLVLVVVLLLANSMERELAEGAQASKIRRLELNALKASEFMVGKCGASAEKCAKILEKLNSTAEIFFLWERKAVGEKTSQATNSDVVCVRRVVVSRGEQIVLEVCAK